MLRFDACVQSFSAALARTRDMLRVYDALVLMKADRAVTDDALRAVWIQTVSSFDFHNHEVFAIEAVHRFTNRVNAKKISVPLDIYCLSSEDDRLARFSEFYREQNSYKSFVSSEKLAEALSCFKDSPWQQVSDCFNSMDGEKFSEVQIRSTINSIWQRRNKIAHEADINPSMAGSELWPIYREDVVYTVDFVERLAGAILAAIAHVE